jgi:hypothetical protein
MARSVPHKTFRLAAEDQFAFLLEQRFGEPTFSERNTSSLIYDTGFVRAKSFSGR